MNGHKDFDKTSRFSDSQILAILKQAEDGIPITGNFLAPERGINYIFVLTKRWREPQTFPSYIDRKSVSLTRASYVK